MGKIPSPTAYSNLVSGFGKGGRFHSPKKYGYTKKLKNKDSKLTMKINPTNKQTNKHILK
jgi:hypothetical protein